MAQWDIEQNSAHRSMATTVSLTNIHWSYGMVVTDYFSILSSVGRRGPAWDESLIEDAEALCFHHRSCL